MKKRGNMIMTCKVIHKFLVSTREIMGLLCKGYASGIDNRQIISHDLKDFNGTDPVSCLPHSV